MTGLGALAVKFGPRGVCKVIYYEIGGTITMFYE